MLTLVTGVAGFIGSSLAARLLARGDDVRGFDNLATGSREQIPDGVDFVEGDLRDPDAVRRVCRDVEIVFHQGALRSVERSVDDPVASHESNATGTINVLDASARAGVRRVIYASSSSVYGDPTEPLRREDQRPDPVSPYGVSKLAGEMYCAAWNRVFGLSTVSLRYFNVFGPRQHPESKYATVFPAFIDALLRGVAPEIHWDGEQSRDFTYVDDVVAANLRAAEAGERVGGDVVNIGAGRAHTVNEVLRTISEALGIWIEPAHSERRAGDVRHTLAEISKARDLLGWSPLADWGEAVRATVSWFASGRPRLP
jgi:UDP-glucose 4-epimerase